jgi:asparagine synthase (glutamine-hydrolysing)
MCGINAIFAYGAGAPPVDRDELVTVRDAMASRGPDGEGLWLSEDGRVGFGHRRLAVIDLSRTGAQPMTHRDGALVITYNGEIYNYQALRDELGQQGHAFRSTSDTEVLLHLYDRYGPEMVDHLRGMYAFAIWDQARRGLFLARDPFGIKPLYYADEGETLRVASQVKALLAGGRIDTEAEPAGHVGFLLWGYVPEPYTLYRDIRALPAGSSLWVDARGPGKLERFFSIREELIEAESEPESAAPDDLRTRLRDALLDSIRHHFVADVPVGVFLSAGLDSTTITALASELQGAGLKTITLGFEEYRQTETDEVPLAAEVAATYGTSHQTRWVRAGEFHHDLSHLLDAMDQPSIDGVNTYFVSKVAADSGLKVVLSGLGGDELFGGYPSFRQIPRLAHLLAPLRYMPVVGRAFRWVANPVVRHFTSPKYAGLLEYGTTLSDAYLLRRGLFMPWELPEVLDPEMVRDGWAELQPRLRLEETVAGLKRDHLQITSLELCWYMRNQLLRDADWASMAHSLEIRVPLVDVRLFRELAPLLASRHPPGKPDMAQAPASPLPEAVLNHRKTGFVVPVREWLQHDPGCRTSGEGQSRERGLRGWARQVLAAAESRI